MKLLCFSFKNRVRGWGGVGGREDPVGGQGGCERRIEVVKMQKNNRKWGEGVRSCWRWGSRGGTGSGGGGWLVAMLGVGVMGVWGCE